MGNRSVNQIRPAGGGMEPRQQRAEEPRPVAVSNGSGRAVPSTFCSHAGTRSSLAAEQGELLGS